jgi:hypothetical protein
MKMAEGSSQMVRHRILIMVLLTWVPLLLLSALQGLAWTGKAALPFVADIEIQVKLLVALPLLILAETKVDARLPRIANTFLDVGLVDDRSRPEFDAAVASATRLRDSASGELLLLLAVYFIGFGVFWLSRIAPTLTNWYFVPDGSRPGLSYAGWWALCVSLPLFQFVVLRWYYRLFIWARFLRQVSRINLKLTPTHPDGTGGLRFLSMSTRTFSVVMLAQGASLAAMMANRIFYEGAGLLDFKVELLGTVALMIFAIIGPLLVFYPKLCNLKREGTFALGDLGQRYSVGFDRKWKHHGLTSETCLLGNPDIQSLADLRNSYLIVANIKPVPFGRENIVHLTVLTLLPVAPLTLTMLSVEQLLDRMLKVIF